MKVFFNNWYIICLCVLHIGFIWAEIKEMWDGGFNEYVHDWWNLMDFAMNSLYLATISLKIVAYVKVSSSLNCFALGSFSNAREHMHTDTLQTPWPSAAVLVTLHARVSAHTSPLQCVCVRVCTFVRWEIQWSKPYNLCSVLHLDMFSRNAFKAINVCVNVPEYMYYQFTVWIQNVGIEGEFMSQLILWS